MPNYEVRVYQETIGHRIFLALQETPEYKAMRGKIDQLVGEEARALQEFLNSWEPWDLKEKLQKRALMEQKPFLGIEEQNAP